MWGLFPAHRASNAENVSSWWRRHGTAQGQYFISNIISKWISYFNLYNLENLILNHVPITGNIKQHVEHKNNTHISNRAFIACRTEETCYGSFKYITCEYKWLFIIVHWYLWVIYFFNLSLIPRNLNEFFLRPLDNWPCWNLNLKKTNGLQENWWINISYPYLILLTPCMMISYRNWSSVSRDTDSRIRSPGLKNLATNIPNDTCHYFMWAFRLATPEGDITVPYKRKSRNPICHKSCSINCTGSWNYLARN